MRPDFCLHNDKHGSRPGTFDGRRLREYLQQTRWGYQDATDLL